MLLFSSWSLTVGFCHLTVSQGTVTVVIGLWRSLKNARFIRHKPCAIRTQLKGSAGLGSASVQDWGLGCCTTSRSQR